MKCDYCVHNHRCTQSIVNCEDYEFDMNMYEASHYYDYMDEVDYNNVYNNKDGYAYWIPICVDYNICSYKCSNCGHVFKVSSYKIAPSYCSHCDCETHSIDEI